jgi:hypothetical protein
VWLQVFLFLWIPGSGLFSATSLIIIDHCYIQEFGLFLFIRFLKERKKLEEQIEEMKRALQQKGHTASSAKDD